MSASTVGERARDERRQGLLRVVVLFHEDDLLGAGRAVLNGVQALRGYGWSVSGWLPGPGPLAQVAAAALDGVELGQRPLAVSFRGWRERPGAAARLRATPRYLASVREALVRLRPHVVHANTLRSLPEALVARRLGLPVVFHVHELPPPSAKRTAAVRLAARLGDSLVCVSEAVAAVVRQHAGGTPVVVAHNGVSVSGAPAAERPRANAGPAFTVGSVGTISRLKGTDVFLRAAALALAQRPQLRFEHAGEPSLPLDTELLAELEELRAAAPLREAVGMLGRRNAEDLLSRWQLFLLPSRMDAFPLATLEAMAAGLPVVASSVGGIPEQIEHLEHGVLVPAGDADALADWIVRLHDDEALRARLAEAGRRRVEERFSVERQAAGVHRAYLLALNRRFGPPHVRAAASRAA